MATRKASIKKISRPKVAKFSTHKIPVTKVKTQVNKGVKLQKFHASKSPHSAGSTSARDSVGRSGSKIPSTSAAADIKPTIPGNY